MDYDYAGKDASNSWRMAAGPGVVFRKYHWEDKHHAPRAYVELALRYSFGLTRGNEDSMGFSLIYNY